MFQEFGCHGSIDVGTLPPATIVELERLSGEWLEYDRDAGAIVVRHIEPTAGPIVPTVVSELVHMLATIPFEFQEHWGGGQLLIHTEDVGRLVRITVVSGGALHVEWAHPDYAGAERRPFDRALIQVEPYEQRLNGRVTFATSDASRSALALHQLADTFEGLYPEGDFRVTPNDDSVEITMRDVNLDVETLMQALQVHAGPGSLTGVIALSSFKDAVPEHMLRLVFEDGAVLMQQPLLWD